MACTLLAAVLSAAAEAPSDYSAIELDVVGGLAGLTQYERHEQRFWAERIVEITGGQVHARILPLERSGVRGQQVLQLLRLGVIPLGNILLGLAAADEPELNAVDLPLLSPDIASLQRVVAAWRPRLETVLRERYGVDLLAVYTYPAQVVFCREAFDNISDLAGRRVRTSSVGQSELIGALGGTPVVIPFADIVSAIRTNVVDCAITAAGSGNLIGLHEVTSHVSRLGISWGVSIFAANHAAWVDLPQGIRTQIQQALIGLEREIWDSAKHETEAGLNCNAGRSSCSNGHPGRMTIVEEGWRDDADRLRLLTETVVPNWVRRCGPGCAEAWNRHLAPELGIRAGDH